MDGTELVEFKMLATMGIPGHFQQQQCGMVTIWNSLMAFARGTSSTNGAWSPSTWLFQPGMVIKVPKGWRAWNLNHVSNSCKHCTKDWMVEHPPSPCKANKIQLQSVTIISIYRYILSASSMIRVNIYIDTCREREWYIYNLCIYYYIIILYIIICYYMCLCVY